MPRINKIRLANINYDYNKKQIPDLTFELNNKDTIFLLANGGGKSLLVQLILQTILPNQSMGKRKVADLFAASSYTAHVVVEWSLDSGGENEHRLATGFCFTEGGGNQPLNYYNYLIDYLKEDQFELSDLPLIKNKDLFDTREPIKFQKLKDWLYEQENYRIEVFNKNYEYQDRLREYGIISQQWKSIAQTNAAEGGVDDFFARSKTASQLLENLLIPQIKNILFRGDDELLAAFSQYRTKLLNMPKIKTNIKHFSLISQQAENLIKDVTLLDNLKEKQEKKKLDLVALGKRFLANIKERVETIEKLADKKEKLLAKQEDLLWQKESYPVYITKLKEEELSQKKAKKESDLKENKDRLKQLEKDKKQLEGLRLYNQARKDKKKSEEYQYRLENLDKKAPQLKKELAELRKDLAKAWQREDKRLREEEEKIKQEKNNFDQKLAEIERDLASQEAKKDELIAKKSGLASYINSFKQSEDKLKDKLGVKDLTEPEAVLAQKEAELNKLKEEQRKLSEKITNLNNQQENLVQKRIDLEQTQSEKKSQFENVKQELEQFLAKAEAINSRLASKSKYWNDLLTNKNEVINYSKAELRRLRQEKIDLAAEILNLEEKSTLLADKDYYIPHHLLVKVKKFLAENDIYTLLGSEWLSEQNISEAKKREHLDKQPLLPYSLIIESGQLKAAKRILTKYELAPDLPLLFIFRNKLANLEKNSSKTVNIVLKEELFVSASSFKEFKDNLLAEIESKENKLIKIKDNVEFFIELRTMINYFYDNYTTDNLASLKQKKADFLAESQEIKQDLADLKTEQSTIKEEIQSSQSKEEKLRSKIANLSFQLEELKSFKQEFKLKQAKQEKLSQLKIKLKSSQSKIKKLKEKQAEMNQQLLSAKQRLQRSYAKLEEHQKESAEFQIAEIKASQKISDSYQELKGQYSQLIKQLNKKQGEREEIEELAKTYQNSYQEKIERINNLAVEIDYLKSRQREVSKAEINEAKRDYQQQREVVREAERLLREVEDELLALTSKIETLEEKITEEFNQATYLKFSAHNHQQELKIINEELRDIKIEIKQLEKYLSQEAEQKNRVQTAVEDLKYHLGNQFQELKTEVKALTEEKWQKLDLTPKQALREKQTRLKEVKAKVAKQKQLVTKNFQAYIAKLKNSNTPQVRQFIKNVEQIMQEGKIYNYDYVESRFLNMLEAFDRYKTKYQHDLKENQKTMQHLTKLSFRRVRNVYQNIIEIPKNSRIKLYGRSLEVIKIDWEASLSEKGEEKIYDYLEQVLNDLQGLKESGAEDDELDQKMEERLSVRNLINVIAPIESCRIRVLKPRSKEIFKENKLDYFDWEKVANWSGGESYSVYMTMFMILISHIRKQIEGQSDIWKTIIADNPFGKASSGHILDTVFEVAKANKIQLISLTAHRQESILLRFPVAYSLKLRNAYNKEVMQSDKLESAFYELD